MIPDPRLSRVDRLEATVGQGQGSVGPPATEASSSETRGRGS